MRGTVALTSMYMCLILGMSFIILIKPATTTLPPSSTLPKVPVVSESEFQSLPSYLKLMTLQNLNQAIHNINKFTAEYPGKCYKLLMVDYVEGIYISMLCMYVLRVTMHGCGHRQFYS